MAPLLSASLSASLSAAPSAPQLAPRAAAVLPNRSIAFVWFTVVTVILLAAMVQTPSRAADQAFDHSEWNQVLQKFVNDQGLVDYKGLAKDRKAFDSYIAKIQRTSPTSDPKLFPTKDDELAYWINAYNAQIFLGVLDLGTDIDSVWSGGLISGRNFFVKRDIKLGAKTTSLKSLEDDIVRAKYKDPRIHAALNCASISCPRLPNEAFTGDKLQGQLDQAMSGFVSSSKHAKVDSKDESVELSKIFDWFKDDFLSYEKRKGTNDPKILDYVNRYRGDKGKISTDYSVDYLDYDKGLNRQ